MRFENVKYETTNGTIVRLRLDTETATVAGTPPAGAVTLGIRGLVNGNRSREFGVHPRGVTLVQTLGTAPETYKRYKFLPVLTPAAAALPGFQPGENITIGAEIWEVLDQVEESLN